MVVAGWGGFFRARYARFGTSRSAAGGGDLYFVAEQPAPAPHVAHPEGRAALRNVAAGDSKLETRKLGGRQECGGNIQGCLAEKVTQYKVTHWMRRCGR